MTVQEGDEGQSIRVIVTATDGDADTSQASATSAGSLVTLDAVPSVSISGVAKEGQVLTAAVSSDADNTFSYQLQSSADGGTTWTAISGATSQTYTVQEGDENDLINVVATVHEVGLADVSVTSSATAAVVDSSTVTVTVTANNGVVQGQQLFA